MNRANATGRSCVALLALGTLGAIASCAYRMLPQRLVVPGFVPFLLAFSAGLSLPYLLTLGLLAWRDGRNGLRLAAGTALANATWALPLGALLGLFGGFTTGNRDQLYSMIAVAAGALLQLPLLGIATTVLWRSRRDPGSRGLPLPVPGVWILAFLLPTLASGGSFLYMDVKFREFKARSTWAAGNSRAARETVEALQVCLARYRESGYPKGLDACAEVASRMTESSGYRFEYGPAVPDGSGRIGAYMLCARPLSFRATGFETVVASSSGALGAGVAVDADLDHPPTCASVLGAESAIAWCALAFAARDPAGGYPRRLADIAACVRQGRELREIGADRLTDHGGESYAYLAQAAHGRATRYRIYRLGRAGSDALWVDEQLKASEKRRPAAGPALDGLPALAVPERFAPGCRQGNKIDCFVAGYEWQRRARQSPAGDQDPATRPMREAALEAFARGCEMGEPRSCVSLAAELETGNDVARDVVRAVRLYERACDLGEADGCRRAAESYEGGRRGHVQTLQSPSPPNPPPPDLEQNVGRAVELHDRACALGDREACFIAGRLLASGEGLAADAARALGFFAQACDEGMALACSRAASLAPGQAAELRQRACVLGAAEDCR